MLNFVQQIYAVAVEILSIYKILQNINYFLNNIPSKLNNLKPIIDKNYFSYIAQLFQNYNRNLFTMTAHCQRVVVVTETISRMSDK